MKKCRKRTYVQQCLALINFFSPNQIDSIVMKKVPTKSNASIKKATHQALWERKKRVKLNESEWKEQKAIHWKYNKWKEKIFCAYNTQKGLWRGDMKYEVWFKQALNKVYIEMHCRMSNKLKMHLSIIFFFLFHASTLHENS